MASSDARAEEIGPSGRRATTAELGGEAHVDKGVYTGTTSTRQSGAL
jgi:hypothetical protein